MRRTHGLTPDQCLSLLVRMKDDFDETPRTWHCPAAIPTAVAARNELLWRAFPRWRNVTGNDGNVPRLRWNQRHRSSTATTSSVLTHARVNDGPFSTSWRSCSWTGHVAAIFVVRRLRKRPARMRPNERLAQQNLCNFDTTPQRVSACHTLVDDNHDTQHGPQLQKRLVS